MELPLTRSQIDRLGKRLKAGTSTDEDLDLLAHYQRLLQPLMLETVAYVMLATFEAGAGGLEIVGRDKQVRSIVAKLQRQSTRLSSMQDLVGARLVVSRARDQEEFLQHLSPDMDFTVIDRRANPNHGYRAVHLIRSHELGSCEVQVRTSLQHQWAELSEHSERKWPGIKYGGGLDTWRKHLLNISRSIGATEEIELRYPNMEQEQVAELREGLFDLISEARTIVSEELRR